MTRPWHCMSLWRRLIHKKIKMQSHFIYFLLSFFFFPGLIGCRNCCYFAVEYPVPQGGSVGFTADFTAVYWTAEVIFSEVSANPVNARPRAFFRVLRHFRREQSAYNHLDCVDLCAVKLHAGFGRISPEVVYYGEERSFWRFICCSQY